MSKNVQQTRQTIDKKMQENIKNYKNQFKSLETFVEGCRLRHAMYIGGTKSRAFKNMVKEIVQNGVDEMVKQDSPGSVVNVTYDARDLSVMVEDDGRGIPFEIIIKNFTSTHTSTNYEKKGGDFSSGLNGIGSKVVNALSKYFIVQSYNSIDNIAKQCTFIEGFQDGKGLVDIPCNGKQGTIIKFVPSQEVLGEIDVPVEEMMDFIRKMVYVTNIGNTINFTGVTKEGRVIKESFVNQEGLNTYLVDMCTKPLIMPIHYSDITSEQSCEFTFTYDLERSTKTTEPLLQVYANFNPVLGGKNVEGFDKGLVSFFRKYMNTIYLANNKKKLTVTAADIRCGLVGVLSTCSLTPVFLSQTKDMIVNEELVDYVANMVVVSLEKWAKEKQSDLQKVCKYLKEIAEVRTKSDEGKVKLSNKYESSATSDLPAKYVRPKKNKGLELIIVEGDSALGSARNSRDNNIQGIMPIRGKIPNALSTPRSKFISNEEIAGIITILGAGYGRNFDLSKCPYEKLIFMTDAL